MSTMFEKKTAKAETFVPDGQVMPDGSVRYKILCDGGINPSGVFWTKLVPADGDFRAAQAERDEKLKELAELQAPE